MATNIWTNGNATGIANDSANWSLAHIPQADDQIAFLASTTNDDCDWDLSVTVDAFALGVSAVTGYTGTVTINSGTGGLTVTNATTFGTLTSGELDANGVGLTFSGTLQILGTSIFRAGSATHTMTGNVTITGGDLIGESSTLSMAGDFNMAAGTYTFDTSTLNFTGTTRTWTIGASISVFALDITGSVTLAGSSGLVTMRSDGSFTNTGTITIDRQLSITGAGLTVFDNSSGTINGSARLAWSSNLGTQTFLVGSGTGGYGTIECGILNVRNSGAGNLIFQLQFALTLGGSCTLDVNRSSSGTCTFDTNDNAFSVVGAADVDDAILDGGASTLTFSDNVDFSTGTFTPGTSTLVMNGASTTLTATTGAFTLNSLTISNTVTLFAVSSTDVNIDGTFTNTSTFTLDTVSLHIRGTTALTAFDNSAGTITDGAQSRTMTLDISGNVSFDNLGTITVNSLTVQGTSGSVNTLTLINDSFTATSSLLIRNNGGTNTILDTATLQMAITGNVTINSGAELDLGASAVHTISGNLTNSGTLTGGSSTFTCSGNVDLSAGTFAHDTSTIVLNGSTLTVTSGETFFNFTSSVSPNTLDSNGFMIVTGTFTNSTTFTKNRAVLINNVTNFNNTGGTIDGIDLLRFQPTSGQTLTNIGTINTNTDIQSNTVTLGAALNISSIQPRDLTIGSTLDTSGSDFAVGCRDVTVSGTFIANGSTITVSGDVDFSAGTFTSGTSTFIMTAAATINTGGVAANEFNDLQLNTTGTVTLLSTIHLNGEIDFINQTGTFALSTFNVVFTHALIGAETYTPWNREGSKTFTTGGGEVRFEPDGVSSGSATYEIGGDYGPLTIAVRRGASSGYTAELHENLECDIIEMGVDGNVTVDFAGFDVGAGTRLTEIDIVNATLQEVGGTVGQSIRTSTFDLQGPSTFNYAPTSANTLTLDVDTTFTIDGSFTFSTTGSSAGSTITGAASIDCQAGSTTVLNGSGANNLVITSDRINLNGIVTSFLANFVDADMGNASSAMILTAFPTSFTMNQCTITATNVGASGIHFSNHTGTYGTANTINDCTFEGGASDVDVLINGASVPNVNMNDCTVNDAQVDSGQYLAIDGTTPTSPDSVFKLWGDLTYDSAYNSTFSDLTGLDLDLRNNDQGGGQDGSLIIDLTVVVESITMENSTDLTVNSSRTFTITAASTDSTLNTTTVSGALIWSPASAGLRTLNIVGQVTVTGASATWTTQAEATIIITDGFQLEADTNANITLEGTAATARLTMSRNDIGGTRPSVLLTNGGILNSFQFADFTDYQRAIDVTPSASDGTIDSCSFTSCNVTGVRITGGTSLWTISNSVFTSNANGIEIQSSEIGFLIENCRIENSTTTGIILQSIAFAGTIRRTSVFNSGSFGLRVLTFDPSGHIVNSVFHGDTADVRAESAIVILSNCIMSAPTPVATGTGTWNVISYNHDNTNTKQVNIFNDLAIDSTLYTIVNEDEYSWGWGTEDWDINISNEFESAGTDLMESDLIPVNPSTAYFFTYDGTIQTSGTVVIFEVDAGGSSLGSTSFSGGSNTLTFTTNALAVNVFWRFTPSASGETVSHAEIRETDSSGNLIFNEDLINNYTWVNDLDSWDYVVAPLSAVLGRINSPALSTSADLAFGHNDYNRFDMTILVDPQSAQGGIRFGRQTNADYFEVRLETTTDQVVVEKVVGGVATTLDSATSTSTPAAPFAWSGFNKLRVRWNEIGAGATGTATTGAIQVFIDDVLIEDTASGGWTTSTTDFVTSTQFDNGEMALVGDGTARFDSMVLRHFGLFLRDVNLVLSSGVQLNLNIGGELNLDTGTANASRSVLQFNGGTLVKEAEWTWLDGLIDQIINGPQTYECIQNIVTVGDITFTATGELTLIGSKIEHQTEGTSWSLITDNSLVFPPMVVNVARFPGVKARFRPLTGGGAPYEVDNITEFFVEGGDPDHELEIVSRSIRGRGRHRNKVLGGSDETVTLRFQSCKNLCLHGKASVWSRDEELLEIITSRVYMPKCIIKSVTSGRAVRGNPDYDEYFLEVQEFR